MVVVGRGGDGDGRKENRGRNRKEKRTRRSSVRYIEVEVRVWVRDRVRFGWRRGNVVRVVEMDLMVVIGVLNPRAEQYPGPSPG